MNVFQWPTLESAILATAKFLLAVALLALVIGWSIETLNSQGETTCADGWSSPSIGRQGACSHHGGEVEITIDRRTPKEKVICSRLFNGGIVLMVTALVLGYKPHFNSLRRSREEKERKAEDQRKQSEWMVSHTTDLGRGFAIVPITIGSVTRLVRVKSVSKYTAETVEKVAVWQPDERPDQTYNGKVNLTFISRGGPYYPDLAGYVSSEYKGRVKAIDWSEHCSAEIITDSAL
jgi:hypothetical protein